LRRPTKRRLLCMTTRRAASATPSMARKCTHLHEMLFNFHLPSCCLIKHCASSAMCAFWRQGTRVGCQYPCLSLINTQNRFHDSTAAATCRNKARYTLYRPNGLPVYRPDGSCSRVSSNAGLLQWSHIGLTPRQL
jgi:hypothetical protein